MNYYSEDINDGQIELVDLSAEVQSLLTATDEDGEPLSSVDASDVTFSADIVNGTGSNMESLIQSIDGVISSQASQIEVIEAEVASLETSASGLESRVTTVETAVTGLDTRVTSIESGTALDSRYVNTSGDTMTGALTATSFTGNGSGLTNLNGSQISTGTVADARIASTIARDTEIITAHSGLSGLTSGDDHTQYLERDGSDTMTCTGAGTNCLEVNGQSSIDNSVIGKSDFANLDGSGGDVEINDDLWVDDEAYVGGNFEVDGDSTFNSDVTINGDVTVTGTISGDMPAVSTITSGTWRISSSTDSTAITLDVGTCTNCDHTTNNNFTGSITPSGVYMVNIGLTKDVSSKDATDCEITHEIRTELYYSEEEFRTQLNIYAENCTADASDFYVSYTVYRMTFD